MNKKFVWVVIGLMGAAVIGAFWLQMDLIRTAIRENEVKFDKEVFDVLNVVSQRLEEEEKKEMFAQYFNGFVTKYFNGDGEEAAEIALGSGTGKTSYGVLPTSPLLSQLADDITNNTCECSKCVMERSQKYKSMMAFFQQSGLQAIPLAERIKKENLREILKQELANRGINIEYHYGLLSTESNGFVIIDDRYVVESAEPRETLPGYQNVYNSKYQVNLFSKETPAPGMLLIYFPARSSFVGRSVLPNLIGALVFTGIILCCFGYTIYVIFSQKKLSEMKNDFINNMTHEFKTPIATISLAADSISSPIISGDANKVKRFADIIKQENKRMNSQVEKVLQMALIDRKEFSLHLDEVNLHEIVRQALNNFSLRIEQREGSVEGRLEARNPVVQGDLTHISNIINNLLDNADKYSPEKPEITVLTRDARGGVEIVVQDKGIGMTKEARKHIFDKFYRVHTGNVHDVKGFGLGLSYVKAIVNAHKGSIDVKSDLGKGSSFTIFLPRQVEAKTAKTLSNEFHP